MKKILVFDSGKGGKYVQDAFKERFPKVKIDLLTDSDGMPYGDKSNSEILQSAIKALSRVIDDYNIVIIACHSLTQAGIDNLRKTFPNVDFYGFDPAIKLAHDMGYRSIAMLATDATKQSSRYKAMSSIYAANYLDIPCGEWALEIENNVFDLGKKIDENINTFKKADAVVLACTHYFTLEEELKKLLPWADIINPTNKVFDYIESKLDLK